MMPGLFFACERSIYDMGFKFYVGSREPRGVAEPLVFAASQPGASDPLPTMLLQDEDAQALIDELWRAGLRPSRAPEGEGIKRHLEDMRTLTFAKLGVPKP